MPVDSTVTHIESESVSMTYQKKFTSLKIIFYNDNGTVPHPISLWALFAI
jgi:hypothetical protein